MESASPWLVSKTNNKPDVCVCYGINRLSVSLGRAQIKLENCVTSNKNGIDMRGRFLFLITVKWNETGYYTLSQSRVVKLIVGRVAKNLDR